MIKLACVGDNCVDFYDETQEIFFGGNPVNVAV
ncbi:MAG TPA: fructoselysine 6-kinase, partial [Bacillota bacterium]|nr:fructoselysine 6-kinase [Bacillota bacterium]